MHLSILKKCENINPNLRNNEKNRKLAINHKKIMWEFNVLIDFDTTEW